MEFEGYLAELTAQLQRLGVAESKISEIVQEVETHLSESGEKPHEAFGCEMEYAEKMAEFADRMTANAATDQWHYRTFRATAFDEMEILFKSGHEGWELLNVGPYALYCRRLVENNAIVRWEYSRRTGTRPEKIMKEMAEDSWQPCGQWIVFHYFKRRIETNVQNGK